MELCAAEAVCEAAGSVVEESFSAMARRSPEESGKEWENESIRERVEVLSLLVQCLERCKVYLS